MCLAVAVVSLLASCSIDKEYDLIDKGVDMTVNVGKGLEFPVGDFKMVSIESMVSASVKKFFTEEGGGYLINWPLSLQVPVQFGTYDVHGISNADTKDIRVRNVEFAMDIVNTIPFRFTCTAEAIDADGNVVENVGIDMPVTVESGNIQKPVACLSAPGRSVGRHIPLFWRKICGTSPPCNDFERE